MTDTDNINHHTIWNFNDDTILEILKNQDISKLNDGKFSLLAIATKRGNTRIVKALLAKGELPNIGADDVNPFFICTFIAPHPTILNLFLETNHVPPTDTYGYTIAHLVVLKNESDMLQSILQKYPDLLLSKTVDTYGTIKAGATPLDVAKIKKFVNCINILECKYNELLPCKESANAFHVYMCKIKKDVPLFPLVRIKALHLQSLQVQKSLLDVINQNAMKPIRSGLHTFSKNIIKMMRHGFIVHLSNKHELMTKKTFNQELYDSAIDFIEVLETYKSNIAKMGYYNLQVESAQLIQFCRKHFLGMVPRNKELLMTNIAFIKALQVAVVDITVAFDVQIKEMHNSLAKYLEFAMEYTSMVGENNKNNTQ